MPTLPPLRYAASELGAVAARGELDAANKAAAADAVATLVDAAGDPYVTLSSIREALCLAGYVFPPIPERTPAP